MKLPFFSILLLKVLSPGELIPRCFPFCIPNGLNLRKWFELLIVAHYLVLVLEFFYS